MSVWYLNYDDSAQKRISDHIDLNQVTWLSKGYNAKDIDIPNYKKLINKAKENKWKEMSRLALQLTNKYKLIQEWPNRFTKEEVEFVLQQGVIINITEENLSYCDNFEIYYLLSPEKNREKAFMFFQFRR